MWNTVYTSRKQQEQGSQSIYQGSSVTWTSVYRQVRSVNNTRVIPTMTVRHSDRASNTHEATYGITTLYGEWWGPSIALSKQGVNPSKNSRQDTTLTECFLTILDEVKNMVVMQVQGHLISQAEHNYAQPGYQKTYHCQLQVPEYSLSHRASTTACRSNQYSSCQLPSDKVQPITAHSYAMHQKLPENHTYVKSNLFS